MNLIQYLAIFNNCWVQSHSPETGTSSLPTRFNSNVTSSLLLLPKPPGVVYFPVYSDYSNVQKHHSHDTLF